MDVINCSELEWLRPDKKALFDEFRIPETNKTLDEARFKKYDKELLFFVYGKKTVLKALSLYVGLEENTHLYDNQPTVDLEKVRSGLVATMESIRTKNKKNTEIDILQGLDILELMKEKYRDRKPKMSLGDNEDNLKRLVALEYLVGTYIQGLSGLKKPDIKLSELKKIRYENTLT